MQVFRVTGWKPEPSDDRPLVYVSLGTSYTDRPDIYRTCIDALSDDYRVVLATGKVGPETLEPLPSGVTAARTQPQLDVLEHASVFVTHAGMGSAAESLWFGVPTVALPQAVDQFANAATLEEIGAGVQPEEPLTVVNLRAAVDSALEARPRPWPRWKPRHAATAGQPRLPTPWNASYRPSSQQRLALWNGEGRTAAREA